MPSGRSDETPRSEVDEWFGWEEELDDPIVSKASTRIVEDVMSRARWEPWGITTQKRAL